MAIAAVVRVPVCYQPEVVVFAVVTQYGLYSSWISSFVYVIFGSAKDITLGPSAISSILTGIYATSPIHFDPNYAIALAFLSGLIELGLFAVGAGGELSL